MKHCPNLECTYLELTGMIAEYEDNIDICPECNTKLEDGEAPFVIPPSNSESSQNAPLFPDELTAISAVDSYDDALWLKEELAKAGIPALIRETELERQSSTEFDEGGVVEERGNAGLATPEVDHQSEDESQPKREQTRNKPPLPAFEVKVMDRHMLPAVNLVQTLLEEENNGFEEWLTDGEEADSDEVFDESDDNHLWGDSEEESAANGAAEPRFITNPLVVLFMLFCVLLAVGYLLFVGFPAGKIF